MKRRVPLREPVGVALETLRAHKLRSFLMLLGIILSVATLIVIIALISGVNQYIANKVANLGSNAFTVMRFPIITEMEEIVKATRRNKIVTLGRLRSAPGQPEAASACRSTSTGFREVASRSAKHRRHQHPWGDGEHGRHQRARSGGRPVYNRGRRE